MTKPPDHQGSFHTPTGQQVTVHWHNNGRESYFVDEREVLSVRKWKWKGTRKFEAGPHSVLIRYSLFKLLCEAYVDGELAEKDVFESFQQERLKNHTIAHSLITGKGKMIGNIVVFVVVFVLISWLISVAAN